MPFELVIVLGCKDPNIMKQRCDTAYEYISKNIVKSELDSEYNIKIMCSGKGNNVKPEAEIIKEYFLSKGLPKEIIFTEIESNNTIENLRNVKNILIKNKLLENYRFSGMLKSIRLCTSKFHICRAYTIALHEFKNIDIKCIYSENDSLVTKDKLNLEYRALTSYLLHKCQ